MPADTLILIRHAESEHHIRRLSGGWTDTPITALGHRQADLLALRLKRELGDTPVRLVTSDLLRARDTARHIADAFAVEAVPDERLREFNNGEAAGLTVDEVQRRWPRPDAPMELDERAWPRSETWREFYERAGAFVDDFDFDGPLTLAVTHGGTLHVLVARWLGMSPETMKAANFTADVTSVTILTRRRGLNEVTRLNDVSHLAREEGWVKLAPP